MKRWKKTGRQRNRMRWERVRKDAAPRIRQNMRLGDDMVAMWGWLPGAERIRRRPVQKVRHAVLQARRVNRVFEAFAAEHRRLKGERGQGETVEKD